MKEQSEEFPAGGGLVTIPNAKEVWQAALGELQLQVSRTNYNTWLKDTVGVDFDGRRFVVGVPNAFVADWLETRLKSLIRKTLCSILACSVEVDFRITQTRNGRRGEANMPGSPPNGQSRTEARSGSASAGFTPSALPLRLNPRYTFETFVVGRSNRLAHAAALAVADAPGRSYNPLFIYGGVGLGKTHLLQAIGHRTAGSGLRVLYVSAEQFTNDFVSALRERRTDEFRARYRSLDVLLIDDIQFIAGKEQTQEEFFHTFNDLYGAGRQVVLSSDRLPANLHPLEDRLRSRFESGLIVDIQPPEFEERVAILQAKAALHGVEIPLAVLELLAQRFQNNIRELEGSLNRVITYARVNALPITLEVAARALHDVFGQVAPRRLVSPQAVLEAVSRYYQVPISELQGPRRSREVATPRQIAMYLMREETDCSLGQIGQHLGGRDHTTIMHGCEKITHLIKSNPDLRREIDDIRAVLYGRGSRTQS
ncbi:MAG: chromosomal replication initiator protein DnaA [Chloroflexota bacterium]